MFGSHNAYGYNNTYGNSPYYSPTTNDPFWPNNVNNKPNRPNYRNPEPSVASDSLYGYQDNNYSEQNLDGPVKHIESGISGLNINSSKHLDDYARKTISWASVASQPAKSQPKSLKSKMASGLTGSTSKHLPPSVTMDAISWDSKNGSSSSGGKTMPPPAVIPAPSIPPPIVPPPASPIEELQPPVIQPPHPPMPRQSTLPSQPNKENSWSSTGNSSSSGSVSTSASSPRPSQTPVLPRTNNRGPVYENNENYNPNKYSNPRSNYSKPIDNQPYVRERAPVHPPPPREVNNSVPHPPPSDSPSEPAALVVDKLIVENDYNPKELDLSTRNARFFIIKSYSEDDIHRSIKYSIWCSTEHGNKRLDNAFRQQEDKGPIYLFFSVNRSGHFCGIAQMMSNVDYNCSSGVWSQDKWKGQFQVKWIYVKDVPNDELRHITLENNENKPVTNSRDTQEVPYDKGLSVLSIIHKFDHRTSIFDDFLHYEKKQEEELQKRPETPPPVPQLPNNNFNKMPISNSHYNSGGGGAGLPREANHQPPFRGNNNYNRSYPDGRDRDPRNDYRNEYRNDHYRNDYRNERADYSIRNDNYRDRNIEPRSDYRDNRDNRDYRDYRENRDPQYHRDYQPRDFHPPPPRGPSNDYPRERNDYRPVDRDNRDYRERVDNRDRNQERNQSWRN